jgi:hypothetical protein
MLAHKLFDRQHHPMKTRGHSANKTFRNKDGRWLP